MNPSLFVEPRSTFLVLLDPVFGILAGLDIRQDAFHGLFRLIRHDLRAAVVIAVLRGVADRIAHVIHAALVNQVDDELHLVQTLKISDLRLVAGCHQRVKPCLDEIGDAAAKHGLLAEKVGLRLFGKSGFDDAGPGSS